MTKFRYGDYVRRRVGGPVGMVGKVHGTTVTVEFRLLVEEQIDGEDLELVGRTVNELRQRVTRSD